LSFAPQLRSAPVWLRIVCCSCFPPPKERWEHSMAKPHPNDPKPEVPLQKADNLYSHSDWAQWSRKIRAQTPELLQVGKQAPKVVLSFGGAGFLATYSLGVALYLQKEQPKLLASAFLLGAGTGVLPAVALACGPETMKLEDLRDDIIANANFKTSDEPTRRLRVLEGCEKWLPENVHTLMNGRCAITVNMSTRDSGYYEQPAHRQLTGWHISTFDNKVDVAELLCAATCPQQQKVTLFRGEPVTRGSWRSLSSEMDQYVRHIYIHGLAGYPRSIAHTRHNHYFGRHGSLCNTHSYWALQFLHGCHPGLFKGASAEALRVAFDNGFHDARRYERWQEDAYHFAKPDRSPGGDADWREIRAAVFGNKSSNQL
jgi:hypothetical protein